jgi:flagellin-like hook-associated protein FlgL
MADNVTLSAAVRSSLLSLESTTKLIGRTQGRLSTGLQVAGAIDDPVKFFQAKTLSDRASDFDSKKDDIDQGISTVTAALDATTAIEDISNQLKGLALSAKSASSTQISDLVTQFNDLRDQIDNLASDAEYQGLNLVNGSGQTLTVQFSTDTASTLTVSSVDITSGNNGLAISKAVTAAGYQTAAGALDVGYAAITDTTVSSGDSITLTVAASADVTLDSGNYTVSYGGQTLTLTVATANASYTAGAVLTAGSSITITAASAGTTGAANKLNLASGSVTLTASEGQRVLDAGLSDEINKVVNQLDTALTTLRTKAQTLGSNVALLQTRFDFTESYVNTLTAGSDKLTLANLNEEGANLLALQTRQQLGISALSFAGQAEQGILGLFR